MLRPHINRTLTALAAALCLTATAHAGMDDFVAGTIVPDFGKSAPVNDVALSEETRFKVAFDVTEAGKPAEVSRRLESPARFLNMHAAAGVPAENMSVAIVVHGPAASDLLADAKLGHANPNADLIAELIAAGATIELCGQTAAARDITAEDLLPGITVSLSAMTAHALLQQEGYTLNPF
jgi:intracellular sulfur oxidation DsrE/DsrF family protein